MSTEVLEFLLSKATITEIDGKSNEGRTPLHNAVNCGTINSVRVLVEEGAADVLAVDNEGKTALDLADKDFEKFNYLAGKMGEVLRDEGKYAGAMEVYKKLLSIQNGKNAPQAEVLQTEYNVALMLFKEKKFKEAMQMFQEVLNKSNDFHGPFHIHTMRTKYEIGKVNLAQFNYEAASECFKKVFENWRDTLGADDKETLSVERDLAFAYFNKHEYDEAFKLFSHVYESRKLSLHPKHPDVLKVWLDMAVVLVNKGESEKGLRILKEIHAARENNLGADHKDTMHVHHHIQVVSERLENRKPEEGGWGTFFRGFLNLKI